MMNREILLNYCCASKRISSISSPSSLLALHQTRNQDNGLIYSNKQLNNIVGKYDKIQNITKPILRNIYDTNKLSIVPNRLIQTLVLVIFFYQILPSRTIVLATNEFLINTSPETIRKVLRDVGSRFSIDELDLGQGKKLSNSFVVQQQHQHRHHSHSIAPITVADNNHNNKQENHLSETREKFYQFVPLSTVTNSMTASPYGLSSSSSASTEAIQKSLKNEKSIYSHHHHHQQQQQSTTKSISTSTSSPPSPSNMIIDDDGRKLKYSDLKNEFNVDRFFPPGYDKLMPPKENGQPTKVRFHVWVLGLDSIDEGSMTYVADIFMSQSWKDHRLIIPSDIVFNVNSSADPRGPYRLLPLTLIDKIWRPDSFFKNAKEVTFQEMTIPNHYIWLYSDNTILYMVKLTLLLSCAMKFQTYPHDTQNCTMKIESLSYTTDDLVFDWEMEDPLVVEEHIELPQHDLIQQQIGDCTKNYSSGVFACVQVVFTIKRRLGYYIFHTYIPTCLIVIMSWISFWIKPEAVPARVTLCVTSLLTLSTQHAQSQKSLPPVSYIKAIDIFMSSCTVFVFASLTELLIVNILISDELVSHWLNFGSNSGLDSSVPITSNDDSLSTNEDTDDQDDCHQDHRFQTNETTFADDVSYQNVPVSFFSLQHHHPHLPQLQKRKVLAKNKLDHQRIDEKCFNETNMDDNTDRFKQEYDLPTIRKRVPKNISKQKFLSLSHLDLLSRSNETIHYSSSSISHQQPFISRKSNKSSLQPRVSFNHHRAPSHFHHSRSNLRLSHHNRCCNQNHQRKPIPIKNSNRGGHNSKNNRLLNSSLSVAASTAVTPLCNNILTDGNNNSRFNNKNRSLFTASQFIDWGFLPPPNLAHSSQPPIQPNVQTTFARKSSKIFETRKNSKQVPCSNKTKQSKQTPINETNMDRAQYFQIKHRRAYAVDYVSRWVFPLSFIMLNVVYWTYYLDVFDSLLNNF